MKVAVVIPKYGLPGGAERFAFEVTERLAARDGLEIHVFANRWRSGESSISFHKIPILTFPRFLTPLSFAHFVDRKTRLGGFDLIHSHDRIFSMDVFTMHCIPHETWTIEARRRPLSLYDRAVSWAERTGITRSPPPRTLAVSNLVRDHLLAAYDVPASSVHVVHPGVSTERFTGLDGNSCRREVRDRYGFSPEDVVVLFVSMSFEWKRLSLVMRGISQLATEQGEAASMGLIVVGKGKQQKYQNLARKLGIAQRVFFTGVVSDVEKYYLASDIFVMPSTFDTFGISVLEAMAAGLPVIISEKVGAKDLVEAGVHGFVVGEDPSPSDVSQALKRLLRPEDRASMGRRCRAVALAHDWDKTADRVEEVYRQIATEKGNGV